MRIKIDPSGILKTRWYEFAVRFFFGGLITAIAGLIAKKFGPGVGGLFLAFPAIFPASATLIEKHEKQRKNGLASADLSWSKGGRSGCRRFRDRRSWIVGIRGARQGPGCQSRRMASIDRGYRRLAGGFPASLAGSKEHLAPRRLQTQVHLGASHFLGAWPRFCST